MGETIIEKIIRHNTGKAVKPGDIVTVNVDRVMIHDIFIPFVAEKFEEMGFTKLHDPDKVVLIYDHLVPASQQDDTRHFRTGDAFADKYGLTHVHRSDGICHQLMTEAGYVKPGDVVKIAPDVVHWHGAAPDSEFTHIAIGTQLDKGGVTWLEPVTDDEYNSYKENNNR